jgi:2-oxoglutarate dehydrogenase E2 component (dihydrolipoamide succinyltransferase)
MATEVKLPDMGDGMEEVTINRWLVSEGDSISEGAALVEVATDKVDTEVPSPVSGTILKLNFGPGELAPLDAVLAIIGEAGEAVSGSSGESAAPAKAEEPAESKTEASQPAPVAESSDSDVKVTPVARRMAAEEGVPLAEVSGSGKDGLIRKSDVASFLEQQQPASDGPALPEEFANVASLAVRRAAADYNVNLSQVADGKPFSQLTKHDVYKFVAARDGLDFLPTAPGYPASAPQAPAAKAEAKAEATASASAAPQGEGAKAPAQPAAAPQPAAQGDDIFVPHNRMRTLIAKNTSQSAFTAPHVTTMWDVNMSAVLADRKKRKREFDQAGVRLTVTAYLLKAMLAGVRAVPAANASWRDDGLVIHRRVHIGMATALSADQYGVGGLIVPVLKDADDLNLMGFARQVNDLAEKARTNSLTAGDLQGGTITLSNYGTSGSRFQTPIIVQPQVGILGVGAIEKRPVIVSQGHPLEANTGDYMTFAPMTTLGFSYDHRVLDGASADAFCAAVKDALENWKE